MECGGKDEKGGHKVYRKPTHTDHNLNDTSYNHAAQKFGILSHLLQVNTAHNILNKVQLQTELDRSRRTFSENGCSPMHSAPGEAPVRQKLSRNPPAQPF